LAHPSFEQVNGGGNVAAEQCEASDEDLVLAAQADRAAFVALYRRYADAVYRYCWRRVETRELAEDLMAQTFVKALAALPNFHAGSFRAWLFAIAHNALTDGYRTLRDHAPLEAANGLHAVAPEPERAALRDETRRELRAALNDLPAEQRDVIELRLAGLAAAEIAEALHRTLPSVKSAQYRAFANLRRALADTNPGERR
jgi:RNA polymerase sigma-70 factor, ECF subfamily